MPWVHGAYTKKSLQPLQDMLHWAMIRATCLAMALRHKLHAKIARCHSRFKLVQSLQGFLYPFLIAGAPNDQFVAKCIIITQLMKINVIKAFSGVFQCCWENIICSLFPERHTRNFPASLIRLVGFPASWSNLFPSQEFRALSNPSIDPKRPNISDKTGRKQVFSASAITLTSRRMFGSGKGFFFFFLVVLSLQSFYSQLGLKC